MSNPWDKFLNSKTLQADLVGGQLIARVDGKHTILGQINLGQLILNEDGQKVADKMDGKVAAVTDEAEAPKKHRGRKAAAEPTPASEPVPEPEPQDHQLTFADDVQVSEKLEAGVETPADEG